MYTLTTCITITNFDHCGYIHSYSSYFATAQQQQMHPPQQQVQERDKEEEMMVAQTLMQLGMRQPQQHGPMNDGVKDGDGVDSEAMDEDDSSDEEYDDYSSEEDEDEYADDPDALPYVIRAACEENDAPPILNLLNNGIKNVNCSDVDEWTPILYSLRFGHLDLVEKLFSKGGDPSVLTREGENALNIAVAGGNLPCIRWALANTSIDINSRCKKGRTPLVRSLWFNLLEVSNFLVGRGANLFLKDKAGQNIINQLPRPRYGEFALGPQVLQHAKDLIWISVRPFFAVAWTATSSASLRSVFGNSDLLRQIAMFFRRDDIIARDPDEEEKPDEVKIRIEAALLLARENSKWGSTLK
jgi:hypothetical protein